MSNVTKIVIAVVVVVAIVLAVKFGVVLPSGTAN